MTDQVICETCGYPLAEVDDGDGIGHYECRFCETRNELDKLLVNGAMYEYQIECLNVCAIDVGAASI